MNNQSTSDQWQPYEEQAPGTVAKLLVVNLDDYVVDEPISYYQLGEPYEIEVIFDSRSMPCYLNIVDANGKTYIPGYDIYTGTVVPIGMKVIRELPHKNPISCIRCGKQPALDGDELCHDCIKELGQQAT